MKKIIKRTQLFIEKKIEKLFKPEEVIVDITVIGDKTVYSYKKVR